MKKAEVHGKLAINAYAEGEEAKCWKEDGGKVIVCQVTNGHAWGFDANARKYEIFTKQTGLVRIYPESGYAVKVAWG